MKTLLIAFIVTIVSMFGAVAQDKPATVVGSWKVKSSGAVWVFSQDGKMTPSTGGAATWKSTPDAPSKYEVTWGGKVLTLTVDPLGKALMLTNAEGKTLEAERVPTTVDPIIGRWLANRDEWALRADGTCASTDGSTGKWTPSATLARKYDVTWGGGRIIASISLGQNGGDGKYKDNNGYRFDIRKLSDTPDK